jgi:hypothetical protein
MPTADLGWGGGVSMTDKFSGAWGWARRWPRCVGAILLAAGFGAWGVTGEADGAPLAAYLAGCAAR